MNTSEKLNVIRASLISIAENIQDIRGECFDLITDETIPAKVRNRLERLFLENIQFQNLLEIKGSHRSGLPQLMQDMEETCNDYLKTSEYEWLVRITKEDLEVNED